MLSDKVQKKAIEKGRKIIRSKRKTLTKHHQNRYQRESAEYQQTEQPLMIPADVINCEILLLAHIDAGVLLLRGM